MTIDIRRAPHREIAVAKIQPNPYRDLKRNPIKQERVEELIGSFERTGFWDNIVVREHPENKDEFQLAYGHNRLATLKDKRVQAEMINIPVAPLSNWEMYCAMVDENEMQGTMTPAIVFENINVGCDLVEQALENIGPTGSFEEFERAIGRVVSADTTRPINDHGFEQARNAWFRGEGLGRRFLAEYLPCGGMRTNNISEVLNTRYAAKRAAAKEAEAEAARKTAAENKKKADEAARSAAAAKKAAEERERQAKRDAAKAEADRRKAEEDQRKAQERADKERERQANEEKKAAEAEAKRAEQERIAAECAQKKAAEDAKKAAEAQAKAEDETKQAAKLSAEAKRIGGRSVSEAVLLMFDSPNRMTHFAQAVRQVGVPQNHHEAAAKYVLKEHLHEDKIESGLNIWWDIKSGDAARRRRAGAAQDAREKLLKDLEKRMRGVTYTEHLYGLQKKLEELEKDIDTALTGVTLIDEVGIKRIDDIYRITSKLNTLIGRARDAFTAQTVEIGPAPTMLTHQKEELVQ